jgi:outer membrane protein OmpA-like peptidoglycan-associated protein
VLENVAFELASSALKAESNTELDRLVEWMNQHPGVRIEVAGYTDSTGVRSSQIQLSQQRAEAVRSYLVQNGIAEARVTAKGYGPAQPRETNSTPEGRARNRRIEIHRIG